MVWLRQMHLNYCLLLIRIIFMPQRCGLFGASLWQQVRGFSERWGFGGLPVLDPFLNSHCWSSLAQSEKHASASEQLSLAFSFLGLPALKFHCFRAVTLLLDNGL